ncbi:Lrp/AsnC family transcriptional regulator [Actinomadura kijaniata]|uniref:DNA-binding Lrp family transcriptional regulator n=1 Tax=Actinomadura namibiensis TaxID=182080 RepID=A0A7W3LZF5_ACTNM|nr:MULTISPECIES: Lrp/AsnC family transcriptional regulator [Actinomadura]MBA8957184.1 DNA-binding Lrp family transcriptional regulator [Actinomadura namibiensis]
MDSDERTSTPGGPRRPERRPSAPALDEIDQRIVEELSRDARVSVRALAERLHISRANAYSRLDRLLEDGVVRGFTVRLDPVKAGFGTSVYVTLKIEQNSWRTVCDRLRGLPAVRHFALLGGDFDVLALVRVRDAAELRALVLHEFHSIPGVRSTRTLVIFEESADDLLLG